jgi:hypothetical protein
MLRCTNCDSERIQKAAFALPSLGCRPSNRCRSAFAHPTNLLGSLAEGFSAGLGEMAKVLLPMAMASSGSNPGEVRIQQYRDRQECDVIVVVRDREMVFQLPDYDQAVKWAGMECRAYKIPENFKT